MAGASVMLCSTVELTTFKRPIVGRVAPTEGIEPSRNGFGDHFADPQLADMEKECVG